MTQVDSFDASVVARGPSLLKCAHLLSRSRHQAQILVQEVLRKAHRRRRNESPHAASNES
ncbi:MAG: hypothetical protein M3P93_12065 [Actinomycetota bacterium]|nr:hypothetical protein [Actinomycetota bacterium]